MASEYILEMVGIEKSFPGAKVLSGVDFSIHPGEIRALMGENGAGKSTLMKILGGIYTKDGGSIRFDGQEEQVHSVDDAKRLGVSIIHQEISLAGNLSVAENIFMGRELVKKNGLVDFHAMYREAQGVLDSMHLKFSSKAIVGSLSIAQQQMVEICRSLSANARILVMDEPTASLTHSEIEELFAQIQKLKEAGVAIIYISHRMDETFRIADSVTVLRDGQLIATRQMSEVTYDDLISMMVGRRLEEVFHHSSHPIGRVLLEARGLTNPFLKNVSFDLRRGEILGFSGLVGAGRTETARALFGVDRLEQGEILLDGRPIAIRNPSDAIQHGIVLVPEDRKKQGLVLCNTVQFNMTIAVVDRFIRFAHVNRKRENHLVDSYKDSLSIKMSSVQQLVSELSGGNQQKVVISKWLAAEPDILILDEPTRGIDVGAKAEIYRLMDEIVSSGVSIILISSELPEIIGLSHRVVVMHEGRVTAVLDNSENSLTQEEIMRYAAGGYQNESAS